MGEVKETVKPEEVKYYPLATEFMNFDKEEVRVEIRFHRPSQGAYKRFMEEASKNPTRAMYNLAMASVHPDDKAALADQAEAYPGIVMTFANELLERGGFAGGIAEKLGK